ncbi:hypothetical protein GCM10023232_23260 [Sphingosinicella ginsenosidimutans]|jgi:hypothetical protein|nr:hypothetical protein [Sphingosinicella ginsenosidimutans]
MKLWKKMQNPFALVGQGFVFGGLLFLVTHQAEAAPAAAPSPVASSHAAR